jgi:ferritin-like metal-binding protein YciE
MQDLFVDELRDAYDAEKQVIRAMPRMVRAATSEDLREAFELHLEETRGQVERLEQVFEELGMKARGKHCPGMEGIIEEAKELIDEGKSIKGEILDAGLIAAAQRVEHYEIAAYGTLVAWARELGHDKAAGLLEGILDQEKATDKKLTMLAEGETNPAAKSVSAKSGAGSRK